jgi:hypothetical protein
MRHCTWGAIGRLADPRDGHCRQKRADRRSVDAPRQPQNAYVAYRHQRESGELQRRSLLRSGLKYRDRESVGLSIVHGRSGRWVPSGGRPSWHYAAVFSPAVPVAQPSAYSKPASDFSALPALFSIARYLAFVPASLMRMLRRYDARFPMILLVRSCHHNPPAQVNHLISRLPVTGLAHRFNF